MSVLLALIAGGCQTKDNTNVNPAGNTSAVVTSGKWTVSYFYDNDKDETSDYNGYSFELKNDNTITATKNSVTTSGTWSETSGDGMQKLVIALNTTDKDLSELNDDWVIETKTDNQLKLKDDNPDRNEQLHFSK